MLSEQQGQTLVKIARQEIEKQLDLPLTNPELGGQCSAQVFQEERGVFVTLHKRKALRGCIGSLVAREPLVEGVKRHALNAAFQDHRFEPVAREEAGELDLEVSVLTEPRDLEYSGKEDLLLKLKPFEDGVIIEGPDGKGATFLPQVWEQLPAPEDFLSRLCIKAGLAANYWQTGGLKIQTYRVQLFKESR